MVNENGIDKRGLILEKALDVFAEKDYQRATIDEIAALADVGKGTVYRYFKNKEDLFLDLLNEAAAARQQVIIENTGLSGELRGKLGRFVISLLRFTKNQPRYFKLLSTEVNSGQEQFLERVREIQNHHQETVYLILQEGIKQHKFREINPLIASVYICKLIEGALEIFKEEPNLTADQIVLTMLDLIWNGLAKK
jgi:AcrR family transcriptional regulator